MFCNSCEPKLFCGFLAAVGKAYSTSLYENDKCDIPSFSPLFWPIRATLNVCLTASHNRANCYVKYAINLVVTSLSVLPDKYKPDPSDAAGARSEQLSDSDGWPAH